MPHAQPASRWIMKPLRSVLIGHMQTSQAEHCTFASSTSSDFRDALGRCTLLRDILIAATNSDGNTHAHRLIKQQPSFSLTTLLAITLASQKGTILFGYPVAHRSISHLFCRRILSDTYKSDDVCTHSSASLWVTEDSNVVISQSKFSS